MTQILLTAVADANSMNLDTGIPVWILVPAIIVIAIISVVVIRWFYNKTNKK